MRQHAGSRWGGKEWMWSRRAFHACTIRLVTDEDPYLWLEDIEVEAALECLVVGTRRIAPSSVHPSTGTSVPQWLRDARSRSAVSRGRRRTDHLRGDPDIAHAVATCSPRLEVTQGGFADDVAVAAKLDDCETVPILTDGAFTQAG